MPTEREHISEPISFESWFEKLRLGNDEKTATTLVQLFEDIGTGLAYELRAQMNPKLNIDIDPFKKRTHFHNKYTWNLWHVGIPDDHDGMTALSKLFFRNLNNVVRPLGIYFRNGDELSTYLRILGFHNGGLADKDDLQYHVFTHPTGQRADAKEQMLNTTLQNLIALRNKS